MWWSASKGELLPLAPDRSVDFHHAPVSKKEYPDTTQSSRSARASI